MGATGSRRATRQEEKTAEPTTNLPAVPGGTTFNTPGDPYCVDGMNATARWLVPGKVMLGKGPPDGATVDALVRLGITNVYCYANYYNSTRLAALQEDVGRRSQIRTDVFQVNGDPALDNGVAKDLSQYTTQLVYFLQQEREVVYLCCTHKENTEPFIGLVSAMLLMAWKGLSADGAHGKVKEIFGGTSPLLDNHAWRPVLSMALVTKQTHDVYNEWVASKPRDGSPSPEPLPFSHLRHGGEPSARAAPPKSTPKKKKGPKDRLRQSAGYEERSRRRAGGMREYHDHHGRSDEEHLAFLREENRELLDEQDGLRDKLMRVEGLVRLLKERAFE